MEALWLSESATDLAQLDTMLTYNLAKYIHDISYGQIKQLESDPKLLAGAGDNNFNPVEAIEQAHKASDLDQFMTGLPPRHHHYQALKTALGHYREMARRGGWPIVPGGETLHPGEFDPRVPIIKKRLQYTQDFPPDKPVSDDTFYDDPLIMAVLKFQKRHGLTADGVIGPQTLAAMNITAAERVETIRLNMARWRWQAHDLGSKYVLVNIASFNLKAYQDMGEKLMLDIPVIVGKEQHQTPVFSDSIKYIEINPFWNITRSIAMDEELPELQKNPHHLVERHVRLFSSWQEDAVELNSTTINWLNVTKDQIAAYRLRQDPGPWNALGKIKFVFPNLHSIYMHDTPAQNLFTRTQRDFSHGCIRVSDPLSLAIYALDGQRGGWNDEKLKEVYVQDSRKVIWLSSPIPVHITYQTTWVDKDGTIYFNRDIYLRDTRLQNAL
jgi:murein L,D-transpeptidase YcbB/YkuD